MGQCHSTDDSLPCFDLDYLFNLTQRLFIANGGLCPLLPPTLDGIVCPYQNDTIFALSTSACNSVVAGGWAAYGKADVYDRVILWRIPLLALWATTMVPPFGLASKISTLTHVVGDPIDTMSSLLFKLELVRRNLESAVHFLPSMGIQPEQVDGEHRSEAETRDSSDFEQEDRKNNMSSPDPGLPGDNAIVTAEKQLWSLYQSTNTYELRIEIQSYYQRMQALVVTALDEWRAGSRVRAPIQGQL